MPLNTMWQRFQSSRSNAPVEPRLSSMEIRIRDFDRLNPALTQMRNVMLVNHRGIEDFSFRTHENRREDINKRIRNARISGGLIAGISLLVGGIGIMNIMLASITERIREIGTRKAIGADGVDIFVQILVESTVIAVVGGLLGLITSEAGPARRWPLSRALLAAAMRATRSRSAPAKVPRGKSTCAWRMARSAPSSTRPSLRGARATA